MSPGKQSLPSPIAAILPLAVVLATGGCTKIVISDAVSLTEDSASVRHDYVFLRPVVLKPAAATSPVSARIEGFGLVSSGLAGSGVTIGWRREQTVLLANAEDCRVIIFADAPISAFAVTNTLAACGQSTGAVCINNNIGRWRAE